MSRAAWLQDRRMQKFRDVLSRWEQGGWSMADAGEVLGMSERQFRRYRDRGLPVALIVDDFLRLAPRCKLSPSASRIHGSCSSGAMSNLLDNPLSG